MKKVSLFVVLLALLGVTACAGLGGPAPLTTDQLKNLAYPSEFPASKTAKLTNGAFEESIVPGSATKLKIQLSDKAALGDLNGDGAGDAAAILISSPGGSGTFYHLVAVVNEAGTPKPKASILLGDRVVLKSISIAAGEIVVAMTKQGPGDPMVKPTLDVTQKYKLQADKLVEVK